MAMNQVRDLEDCDPNDVSRPSVSPTDRRLFLAEAQAAKGVSINQATINGRPVSTYFAKPDKKDAPVAILIHE